jgi:acyl-[acyl-carrier-protein]-phospholipid O-acyltransferase/long-chain-fatty-acid--[acyl-carrier-protein] ligase
MPDAYRLQIRGPNIMVGYLYAEQPGVIVPPTDGWHDTGDIVRLAPNGALQLAGRAKRFAKIGGEMVSLDAIETLARKASPTAEQAVVLKQENGKPDEIVLFTTDSELRREHLAAAAKEAARSTLGLPGNDNIRVLPDIPKLATGKTDYVTLKGMLADFNQAAARPQESVATSAAAPSSKTPKGDGPKAA